MVDSGIRTLFLRCTDGRFTDKLEPTSVVEFVPIAIGRTKTTSVKDWYAEPLHYSTLFAVRTGIEPVATDRQSVMLTITPTNPL